MTASKLSQGRLSNVQYFQLRSEKAVSADRYYSTDEYILKNKVRLVVNSKKLVEDIQ